MNTTLLAIDPGESGGLAWIDDTGKTDAIKMPDTLADISELISDLNPAHAIIEKVGTYMPGNSGPSACKFARHCGALDGMMISKKIPHKFIAPGIWMKSFLGTVPKKKNPRKNAIKTKCQQLYPHLKITLATADALGILTYCQITKFTQKE